MNIGMSKVIDEGKYKRQLEGTNKWKANNGIGTLHYTMRFGKTYVGILIMQRVLEHNPNCKIIIIVPSIVIINNWANAIEDEGLNKDNITIATSHEVLNGKYNNVVYRLRIIDEVHKFFTDERFKIISGEVIKSPFLLCLTGSLPADISKLSQYCPIIDSITEQEAIDNNWISNYTEYNLGLELSDEDKIGYIKFSEPISETLRLFKNCHKLFKLQEEIYLFKDEYDLIQSCYSGKKISKGYIKAYIIREQLASKMGWSKKLDLSTSQGKALEDYWNPVNLEIRTKTFVNFVRKRTEIIHNNTIKLNAVLDIYNKFPNKTICFNESIDFAERIKDSIRFTLNMSAICYHSKIISSSLIDPNTNQYYLYMSGAKVGEPKMFGKKAILDDMLKGMINGKYNFLSTARALDEGIDIPNLEQIITTAGSANPIQYSQRSARAKTIDCYNPSKIARIINLYFDDFQSEGETIRCRDKQKLRLRQKFSNSNVNWVNSLDDVF